MDFTQFFSLIFSPFFTLGMNFIGILPPLIASIILLALGFLLAHYVGLGITWLLNKLGLDRWLKSIKATDSVGQTELSSLFGTITKYFLFVWFLVQTADIMSLGHISGMLNEFIRWLPDLALAIITLVLGLILADIVSNKLMQTRLRSVRLVSVVAKIMIIFFAVVIALKQINLYVSLAQTTFMIILVSVCLSLAVAFGIGFGSALKDESREIIKNLKKNI